MELTSLISQLTEAGIADLATIVIIVLYVRYSSSETCREISKEIYDKIGAVKNEFQQSFQDIRQEIRETRTDSSQAHKETRQEINAVRAYAEQSHKKVMLHLIDIRERLANIEGRLGAPTPRMSAVSPPLETSA